MEPHGTVWNFGNSPSGQHHRHPSRL
jgi:hypothetical protein